MPRPIHLGSALLVLVVGLQLAYLISFFSMDLPNATLPGPAGRRISRLEVWESVPGLLTALAARLSRPHYLAQRLPVLSWAAVIAIATWACGDLIVRRFDLRRWLSRAERVVVAYGLGTTALALSTLGLGLAGWMAPAIARAGLGLILALWLGTALCRAWGRDRAAAWAERDVTAVPDDRPGRLIRGGMLGVMGLFLALMILGAMLPSTDFDVCEYHLQGPKEWFLAGRVRFLAHNVYTTMPFQTEMLSLLSMIATGDWRQGGLVGQTVLAVFAPMTALGLWAAGRRWFSPLAGWLAALVYLTTPWIYRLSIIAYVEGGLCFYLFGTVLVLIRAVDLSSGPSRPDQPGDVPPRQGPGRSPGIRLWTVAGALAGAAAACKYPGLVSVVVPGAAVAALHAWPSTRRPDGRALAGFCLGVVIGLGPWLVRNAAWTGNPTYPLLSEVFGGRFWSTARNAQWNRAHHAHAFRLVDLGRSAVDVTARSDWLSPLLFGFAPLALLPRAARRRSGWLWLYVGYLFLTWWGLTHRLDRFWVPLIPLAALLAGAGAAWLVDRRAGWVVAILMAASITYNLAYSSSVLCGPNGYTDDLDRLQIESTLDDPAIALVNDSPPAPAARVLFVGEAGVYHCAARAYYSTVFNDCLFEQRVRGRGAAAVQQVLRSRAVASIVCDWSWIERYRAPGNYGFTSFVQPDVFDRLVRARVLDPPLLVVSSPRAAAPKVLAALGWAGFLVDRVPRPIRRLTPERALVVVGVPAGRGVVRPPRGFLEPVPLPLPRGRTMAGVQLVYPVVRIDER